MSDFFWQFVGGVISAVVALIQIVWRNVETVYHLLQWNGELIHLILVQA